MDRCWTFAVRPALTMSVPADDLRSTPIVAPEPRVSRARRGWATAIGAAALVTAVAGAYAGRNPVAAQGVVAEINASAAAQQPAVRNGRLHRELPEPPAGKIVFPVDATTGCALFRDSFGASRGSRTHEGTDIMGLAGRAVYAVADGVLTRRYTNTGTAGYGWTLHDAEAGISYKYFHLTADAAGRNEGETVRVGDVIGYVGDSGTLPGNHHLHFEYRVDATPTSNGTAVDPIPYFDIPIPPCRIY